MIAQFDSLYDSLVTARCSVRVNGRSFYTEKALCSGIGLRRDDSEFGTFMVATATLRIKQEDEDPANCLCVDTVIDIKQYGSDWKSMRVSERTESAGVITLQLQTANEVT